MPRRVMKASLRPRRRTTGFRKAVAKIAKKTVMGQAETKIAVQTTTVTFGTSGTLLQSGGANGLFNGITQGAASSQRIGDKIKVVGVRHRQAMDIDPAIVTARRENITYRVILATNKQDQLTTGDFPTFLATTDPEKMTVLMDRYFPGSSTRWTSILNKYVKWNRIAKYSGSQCIGKNLYMWIVPSTLPTGATTTTGYGLSGTVEIFYKDV